jgi:hypothetical protein
MDTVPAELIVVLFHLMVLGYRVLAHLFHNPFLSIALNILFSHLPLLYTLLSAGNKENVDVVYQKTDESLALSKVPLSELN